MPTVEERAEQRHLDNLEKMTRILERLIVVEQRQLRIEAIVDDVKIELGPIHDAFVKAKGMKAASVFIGILILTLFGAGSREVLEIAKHLLGGH